MRRKSRHGRTGGAPCTACSGRGHGAWPTHCGPPSKYCAAAPSAPCCFGKMPCAGQPCAACNWPRRKARSEEHTSELQSLMRISYAVFCLKKKNNTMKQQFNENYLENININSKKSRRTKHNEKQQTQKRKNTIQHNLTQYTDLCTRDQNITPHKQQYKQTYIN